MSEEKEQLGEFKIGSCTYGVYRDKSKPEVVVVEGISCDIKADVEKGNQLIQTLFGGSEVRFRAPKLVKEEDNSTKT